MPRKPKTEVPPAKDLKDLSFNAYGGTTTPTPPPRPTGEVEEAELGLPAHLKGHPEVVKFEIAKRIAHTLAQSNLVPESYRGRPADCFIAIQMGQSVGMDAFQAIQSIAVIGGKPCLYGDGLLAVVRASGLCEYVKETLEKDGDTLTAFCETKRKGEVEPVKRSFSWAEAETAGLSTRDLYRKFPYRMVQMRARGLCLRDVYADALKGLALAEEVIDYNTEPAPIREFALPTPTVPVTPVPSTEAVTPATNNTNLELITASSGPLALSQVTTAFAQSKDMTELLKASNLTKRLVGDQDIKHARDAYRTRRSELTAGDQSGSSA